MLQHISTMMLSSLITSIIIINSALPPYLSMLPRARQVNSELPFSKAARGWLIGWPWLAMAGLRSPCAWNGSFQLVGREDRCPSFFWPDLLRRQKKDRLGNRKKSNFMEKKKAKNRKQNILKEAKRRKECQGKVLQGKKQ